MAMSWHLAAYRALSGLSYEESITWASRPTPLTDVQPKAQDAQQASLS